MPNPRVSSRLSDETDPIQGEGEASPDRAWSNRQVVAEYPRESNIRRKWIAPDQVFSPLTGTEYLKEGK